MTDFTRVTVIGRGRRATLVLPSEEPIAVLLPDIADVLAEPPVPDGHVLISNLGVEVSPAESMRAQEILSGTVLRLLPASTAPAPPEVSDVTDAVAEQHDNAAAGWNDTHRAVATGVALGAIALVVTANSTGSPWLAPLVFALSGALAAVLGWTRSVRTGLPAVAPALGAIPQLTHSALPLLPGHQAELAWPVGLGLLWLALGVAGAKRSALGGGIGVLLAALSIALAAAGAPLAGTAAVLAVCVIVGLGLLPLIALTLSGVTVLDDHGLSGAPVHRTSVLSRVQDAYRIFSWAVAALAGFGALALAALLSGEDPFAALLGLALFLVLALRTRVMPLAVQAWSLWGALFLGVLAAAALSHAVPPWLFPTLGSSATVLVVLLGTLRPQRHSRVRWRRLGDFAEGLAALASLPLLLGTFGIYQHLLGVFP